MQVWGTKGRGAEGMVQKGEAGVALPPRALGAWLSKAVLIRPSLSLQGRQQLALAHLPPSSTRTKVPPAHTAMLKVLEPLKTISIVPGTRVRDD